MYRVGKQAVFTWHVTFSLQLCLDQDHKEQKSKARNEFVRIKNESDKKWFFFFLKHFVPPSFHALIKIKMAVCTADWQIPPEKTRKEKEL